MTAISTKLKLARVSALIVALTAIGCSDTGVVTPNALKPARNGTSVSASGALSWLPPLGTGTADPATFDALAASRVEICAWTAGACVGTPVAKFATAPVAGEGLLTKNTTVGRYEATWNLLDTKFTTRRTYRIRALIKGSTEIGGILVDVVRGRWALTRTDGTLAPLVAASNLAVQFHVALPLIKVNEVESNGGTPGDWVEFYNAGATDVDVSGFVFKDNDDTHSYAIPAGTVIPAGAYLVLDESAFGFGLGGAESARLFNTSGTLVDSYSWLAHAVTTYGRCPNGTGAFITMTATTKGAANDCTVPNTVRINEVESNGGTPGDWAELYNTGAIPVDVSGFVFKDNDDTHSYTIPAGTVIPAGGYFVLDEAAFGFGLGGADAARLFDNAGALRDSYSWTAHASITYGRCPNGVGAFITMPTATKGAANDCAVPTTLKVNEVESNGGTPGDWVELYNTGSTVLDISGFVFKDNDDTHAYIIPAGTVVAPGSYFVLEEAAFGFGLGANESARIFDQGGAVVDSYSWLTHAATTYGRCPNGTGGFVTMTTVTKGAANDCAVPNTVKINEVESSGGTPGDWTELHNTGAVAADISGFVFKDNDDTHVHTIPAGTIIPAGGYYVIEEAAQGFGLGSADAARLFDNTGALRDSYSWTAHASTTYGRCPNGVGAFVTMTTVTKGAANDCAVPTTVKVNEVESNGGTPGDWVELYNTGSSAADVSGFVFKDNDDTHVYAIPAGTVIAAGGYLVLEESAFGFGLGAMESARLFDQGGALVDSHSWTSHAPVTYSRCPNGTGAFIATPSTKGAANDCGGVPPIGPVVETWPGTDNVTTVDGLSVFGGNLSGLTFEGGSPDVLWAARNGPGSIFRLIFNGAIWTPDAANGWSAGKLVRYTDGTGEPDTEDITFTTGSSAGMYIVSERNNSNNGVSRPSILRYDVSGASSSLTATNEWLLTADLPPVAANSGLEAITWIPDAYLVAQGFFDVTAGHLYNPAEYANHGGGLFFVGLEGNGLVYVYALNHTTNAFQRIASFSTGFPSGVMALQFDRELGQLWATCDDTCGGLSNIYVIDATPASPTLGRMKLTHTFARASTMPNINNEGFAFAPQAACVGGFKPVFWSDDSETGGHSIRRASIPCVKFP